MRRIDELVHALKESHGFTIVVAAIPVGQPFARLSGIVEVEHRRHGIDPEAVDVEPVEPVDRVGDQEARDLAAREVVDGGVPIGVETAARVGIFVDRGAVEAG